MFTHLLKEGFSSSSVVKNPPAIQEMWETQFNLWVGKTGGRNGNPLQYSCLIDRGESESRSVVSDSATPWTIQSMEFSCPRDQTEVSHIAGGFLTS